MKRSGLLMLMLLSLAMLAQGARGAAGPSIRVRATGTAGADGTVRVGDVAILEGFASGQAETLAQTVVVAHAGEQTAVKAEQVLGVLLSQDLPNSTLQQLQIIGAAVCQVGRGAAATTLSPASTAPLTAAPAGGGTAGSANTANRALAANDEAAVIGPKTEPVPAGATTPPASPVLLPRTADDTLASILTRQVATLLKAAPDEVRVSFDTVSPLLTQIPTAGQGWQIKPLTKEPLGTVLWEAQLIEKSKSINRVAVQATVRLRTNGLVATTALARGDMLTAAGCRVEERWVDRRVPTQNIGPEDVVGMEAVRALDIGATIDQRDFKAAELVTRGQVATVHVVSGGLRIKTSARALESGRLHDRIGLRNETTGERIDATVIGKGVVVLGVVDQKTEENLREQK